MIHKLKVSNTIRHLSNRVVESIPSPISEGDLVIVSNTDGTEDTYLVKNPVDCLRKCRECSLFYNKCLRYNIYNGPAGGGVYTCVLDRLLLSFIDPYTKDTNLVFKDLGNAMEDL